LSARFNLLVPFFVFSLLPPSSMYCFAVFPVPPSVLSRFTVKRFFSFLLRQCFDNLHFFYPAPFLHTSHPFGPPCKKTLSQKPIVLILAPSILFFPSPMFKVFPFLNSRDSRVLADLASSPTPSVHFDSLSVVPPIPPSHTSSSFPVGSFSFGFLFRVIGWGVLSPAGSPQVSFPSSPSSFFSFSSDCTCGR